jgi:hypothetical protein
MAGTNAMQCVSINAGADLSALQFTAVKYGTDRAIVGATDSTEPLAGLLMNKPISGQPGEVCVSGFGKGIAGGAISSGDKVTATTGGKLIATVTNNQHYVGFAAQDAATNDVFQVQVAPGQVGA